MSNYDQLIARLDAFVRRYYKNQLIKGLLYFVALVLGLFLVIVLAEYFGRFSQVVRTVIFFAFSAVSLFVLVRWLVIPLANLARLGKIISHEQASVIIGTHFSQVNDKLLNTLQLKEQTGNSSGLERALLEAAIDQKTIELKPVPFSAAIDFNKNRKYLKYALPPVLALIFIIVVSPSILKEGTERMVAFNREFIPQAPFRLTLLNKSLKVVQQEDFVINVGADGQVLPSNVYLEVDGNRFKLDKLAKNRFSFTLKNVQQSTEFRLEAEGFSTNSYELEVLEKPVLTNFSVTLEYPAYLKREPETLSNQGDFSVPQGTKVKWTFSTKNTDAVLLQNEGVFKPLEKTNETFSFSQRLMKSFAYSVSSVNKNVRSKDTLNFNVGVIADQYPEIAVEERKDSLSAKLFYFSGNVKDDYGFSRLSFLYKNKAEGERASFNRTEIKVDPNSSVSQFFHVWNLYEMDIKPGEEFVYYFEITDNDGVNGPKTSRSAVKELKIPTRDELEEQEKKQNEDIKNSLSQGIKEAKSLQKDFQKLQREMLNDKNVDWKDKKQLKELLDREKELEKRVEQIKQENETKNFQQSEFDKQQSQEILDKQKQLEQLFDKLMTPEMKELYKQMEELMNKVDQEKLLEKMNELQMKNQDVEKEMDRMLDLFKQLEFEQKMTESIDKLKELGKEQKELAKQSEEGKKDNAELQKKQEELNQKFEKLTEELKDLDKKADELKNEMSPEKTEQQQKEIKEQQQNASEQLNKKQNKKAAENQQKSGEQMEQMAEQLDKMMKEEQQEQKGEDMAALRQLLENLIHLSFDQEKVMQDLKKTGPTDPKYVQYTQLQKKYKDDAKIIKDSLFALSKRVAQLEATVNREIGTINRNMDKAIDQLAERQTPQANASQQYVMTSLNNLALILDEALKQMQKEMSKPSDASCSKPGAGKKPKPGKGSMSQMQDKMAKQLEEMRKEMEKGKKPGEKKPGEGSGPGMSEQLAKMAAQQAAIRRQVEKMSQELNKEGKGAGNQLKDIAKQMEETEKDIVNKNIKPETMRRQQEIMTRLLEHEKAQREREQDNKRESKSPVYPPVSNPQSYFDYQKKKQNEVEMLKTMPAGLKPYYKNKSEQYLNGVSTR
ncbi:MAG: DUF4175 family protein [Bacteroidota bacterium]